MIFPVNPFYPIQHKIDIFCIVSDNKRGGRKCHEHISDNSSIYRRRVLFEFCGNIFQAFYVLFGFLAQKAESPEGLVIKKFVFEPGIRL